MPTFKLRTSDGNPHIVCGLAMGGAFDEFELTEELAEALRMQPSVEMVEVHGEPVVENDE